MRVSELGELAGTPEGAEDRVDDSRNRFECREILPEKVQDAIADEWDVLEDGAGKGEARREARRAPGAFHDAAKDDARDVGEVGGFAF